MVGGARVGGGNCTIAAACDFLHRDLRAARFGVPYRPHARQLHLGGECGAAGRPVSAWGEPSSMADAAGIALRQVRLPPAASSEAVPAAPDEIEAKLGT